MSEDAHDDLKQVEDVLPNPSDHPRNKRMAEIADAEAQRAKDGEELVDVSDEDHAKTVPVGDEEPEPAAAAPQKWKIKANGQEQELSQDEILKLAEKAAGADAKFEEAARMRREAEEIRARPSVEEARPQPAVVVDDDRALARALQMGSEEEAAGVIRQIRSQAVNPGQIAGMVEMITSGNWFRQEYPDVFADPWLQKIALDEDERMVKSGDRRAYKERYKAIGDKLREWKGTQAAAVQEKIAKKADLKVVPRADVRNAPQAAEDADGPTDAQFIAAEAKRRGRLY